MKLKSLPVTSVDDAPSQRRETEEHKFVFDVPRDEEVGEEFRSKHYTLRDGLN